MRWFGKKKEESKGEIQNQGNLCSECGSELIRSYDEMMPFDICMKCKRITYEGEAPPLKMPMQIFIGKVLVNADRYGFVRMNTEYPETNETQIIRIWGSDSNFYDKRYFTKPAMRKGDTVAFFCYKIDENGIPQAIYYQNLTMGNVKGALMGNDINVGKFLFSPRPMVTLAEHYLSQAISDYRSKSKELKKAGSILQNNLQTLSPSTFEEFIGKLFELMGYSVENLPDVGDYGADLIARKDNDAIVIQCKQYSDGNHVGAEEVQKTLGAMWKYKANKSILVTTSSFTVRAEEQAKDAPIELWDKKILREMIEKYQIKS